MVLHQPKQSVGPIIIRARGTSWTHMRMPDLLASQPTKIMRVHIYIYVCLYINVVALQ